MLSLSLRTRGEGTGAMRARTSALALGLAVVALGLVAGTLVGLNLKSQTQHVLCEYLKSLNVHIILTLWV